MGKRRTDEEFAAITANYEVLKDFYTNAPSAYAAIRKRGLLEEICSHMTD